MNGLAYLGSSILGTILGTGVGVMVGNKLSAKEREELKSKADLFNLRMSRDPKKKNKFENLKRELEDIKNMPKGPKLAQRKLDFISKSNDFLQNLSERDKKLYLEILSLTDKVTSIRSNSGSIGFFLGGILGVIIGERI